MWRSRSDLASLALVLATGLASGLLAGCSGDDPEPRIAPSSPMPVSPSDSPSASGPVEPTMPAAAKRHTAAGAEAFVRFYWEMADYAQATGDTSGLKPLAEKACGACRAGQHFVEAVYQNGGTIDGGETTLSRSQAHPFRTGGHAGFQVAVHIANTRQVVHYAKGRKDKIFPPADIVGQFIVEPTHDGWSVAYWTTQS